MKYLFMTAAILAAQVQAGDVSMSGQGSSRAPADYVQISVLVRSQCYKTATEAMKENAKLADEILTSLKTYASTAADIEKKLGGKVVTAVPGALAPEAITKFDRKTQEQVTVCSGFSTSNTLTLNLLDKAKLAEVLDKVAASTDKNTFQADGKEPQTWAEYQGNSPSLFPAHRKEVRREALKNGVADLKEDLAVLSEACALSGLKITNISVNEFRPQPKFAARAMRAESADAGGAPETPAEFNDVSVNVTVNFSLSYEGGQLQCELPEKPTKK